MSVQDEEGLANVKIGVHSASDGRSPQHCAFSGVMPSYKHWEGWLRVLAVTQETEGFWKS